MVLEFELVMGKSEFLEVEAMGGFEGIVVTFKLKIFLFIFFCLLEGHQACGGRMLGANDT